ncbi:MAG: Asp23/Gls24 family envelope stress response protein [Anaerolineae bacterium]
MVIDLFVVIQYGTRISEVAQNVMETVKFGVERSLGMPVAEVNVHVQGLHMNNED